MARLMGVALCLVMPSLIATTGMEAWGDDASALLQVDTAMASIQTESFTKSVVALHSLLAVAQKADREHSASLVDSTEFYMSTVQPQMGKASDFIVNKLATLSATKEGKSKNTTCTGCWVTTVIDVLTLVYEAGANKTSNALYQRCSPVVLVVWWLTGMLTMTLEQNLTIPDAMDMLAQQFTSIGYGSSKQTTVGLKVFHGLHGVVSQMSVNRVMSELFDSALNTFEKTWANKIFGRSPDIMSASVNLLIITALTTFIFALDLGGGKKLELLDGFYQALITMTTIGYGDMSPETQWGRAMSPLTLPMLSQALNRWKNAAGPNSKVYNENVKKENSFADMEVCSCLGWNLCRKSK